MNTRRLVSIAALLACAAPATAARADGSLPGVVAPAGGGQRSLAVGFVGAGELRARVCGTGRCGAAGGTLVDVPAEVARAAAAARFQTVSIGRGRSAVHLLVSLGARSWETVVVAVPGSTAPRVVFNGWTGLIRGQDGLRRGPMVQVSERARDGARRIVVGEQREDMSLCGRPAVLSPELLLADDLKLHPAKVQRLGIAERNAAPVLVASRLDPPPRGARLQILRAVAASSGARPDALTDADPETTWAEGRGGAGRGEFALMHAPPEVSITGFDVTIRPVRGEPAGGVAPRTFWIATRGGLFGVTLAENAWQHPGATYRVELPKPVSTDCVALVVESAYDEAPASRVSFAELSAITDLDATDVAGLVAVLAKGGPRGEAAAALLRSSGPAAFEAVDAAFDHLDEAGRRLALDVVDHAPCDRSVHTYVKALASTFDAHRRHARDRIRRCPDAAEALVRELGRAKRHTMLVIAEELAITAPDRAVAPIVRLLGRSRSRARSRLRVILARAASGGRADDALRVALSDREQRPRATIDLLRALGDLLPRLAPASTQAFERVAATDASFRTRYLLLEPAAELRRIDRTADVFLRRALTSDSSHHVRARAARLVDSATDFREELLKAVRDRNVRVREAAASALGRGPLKLASAPLLERLERDPWPLVRAMAAASLGRLEADPSIDRALAAALGDESPHVRRPVVAALGSRRAISQAQAVRDRLEDRDERPGVRAAAARALGEMCDFDSVDVLTEHASKLADPFAGEAKREVGAGALWALGRLHPVDLERRLAPLGGDQARTAVRRAYRATLLRKGSCGTRS